MDPGRPKQPTGAGVLPGQPALESVVQAHSDQLIQLNTELSSALAQVTGEMGNLRTSAASTSTVLASLASQVTALTGLVTRLFPAPGGEFDSAPPAAPTSTHPSGGSLRSAPGLQVGAYTFTTRCLRWGVRPVPGFPGAVRVALCSPALPVPVGRSPRILPHVLADGAGSGVGSSHGQTKPAAIY